MQIKKVINRSFIKYLYFCGDLHTNVHSNNHLCKGFHGHIVTFQFKKALLYNAVPVSIIHYIFLRMETDC